MPVVVLFGNREQIPRTVLVGITHPGRQRAVHPAAGDDALEGLLHIEFAQIVAERRQDEIVVCCQVAIQRLQELVAVVRIRLPCVFAVEHDRYHGVRPIAVPTDRFEVADQVRHGVFGVPVLELEADQIRQAVVTKEARRAASSKRAMLTFDRLVRRCQAVGEDSPAARAPAEAGSRDRFEGGHRDRALGWPAAD